MIPTDGVSETPLRTNPDPSFSAVHEHPLDTVCCAESGDEDFYNLAVTPPRTEPSDDGISLRTKSFYSDVELSVALSSLPPSQINFAKQRCTHLRYPPTLASLMQKEKPETDNLVVNVGSVGKQGPSRDVGYLEITADHFINTQVVIPTGVEGTSNSGSDYTPTTSVSGSRSGSPPHSQKKPSKRPRKTSSSRIKTMSESSTPSQTVPKVEIHSVSAHSATTVSVSKKSRIIITCLFFRNVLLVGLPVLCALTCFLITVNAICCTTRALSSLEGPVIGTGDLTQPQGYRGKFLGSPLFCLIKFLI